VTPSFTENKQENQKSNENNNQSDKDKKDQKNSKGNESFVDQLKNRLSKLNDNDPSGWRMFALAVGAIIVGISIPYYLSTITNTKEINIKEFKQELLARGRVHKINVDCETQKAFIYLKENPNSPAYHIVLGPDFASFDRQIETAEAELGLPETEIEYTWSALST
jgi:hypothetical protein